MDLDIESILARFEPVELVDEVDRKRVDALRELAKAYVRGLHAICGPGRYFALALTAAEEAALWSVKSVTHG